MPMIKARTRGKHIVRHITRLDRENLETLFAYATFLSEPPDYVLNQMIDTLLARDKEFAAWREQHPGPHAPHVTGRKARRRSASTPPAHAVRTADAARHTAPTTSAMHAG